MGIVLVRDFGARFWGEKMFVLIDRLWYKGIFRWT